MPDEANQEKKILIDEDWKSQVQAEKEALKQQQEQKTHEQPSASAGRLPPASLPVLYSSLATQAMVHLGQIPNPVTGRAEVQLEGAKHVIDMLQVLEEKTEGNRTPEETTMLTSLLHELRMAYVAVQTAPPPSADAGTGTAGP